MAEPAAQLMAAASTITGQRSVIRPRVVGCTFLK